MRRRMIPNVYRMIHKKEELMTNHQNIRHDNQQEQQQQKQQ